MLQLIFSSKAMVAMSVLMFLLAVALSIGNFAGLIGQGEPFLVYQMSALALIYAAYTSLEVAVGRIRDRKE